MNPNFKKKKPLPYKNLGELYIEAVEGEPPIGLVPTPHDPQENKEKNASYIFDAEAIINSQIKWSPEQKKYFKNKEKGGTGKGELSVAMLVLQSKNHKTPTEEELAAALSGGGHTFDVKINNNLYEVKQANVKLSVRTGTKGTAQGLFTVLTNNLAEIYNAYDELTDEDKDRLDKISVIEYNKKPTWDMDGVKYNSFSKKFYRNVRPLEYLLQSAILYIGPRQSLARGAIIEGKSQDKIPKIWKLPGLLQNALKNLNQSPIKEENKSLTLDDRLEFIQSMYPTASLSRQQAMLIDRKARSYGKAEVAPGTLEEFEAVVVNSPIFNSEGAFKKEIQTVFTDTPIDRLKQILPVTGLFIVDEKGWTYAGYNKLNELVKIASITQGKYKIIPKDATEDDIAAAENLEEIPELAV